MSTTGRGLAHGDDAATPGTPCAAQPIIVIDGKTLQLVQTSSCNEEISLPAGTYVVSATLPSGERADGGDTRPAARRR